jgi:hypothetical protein
MADQSDVEATLASRVTAILYPAGTAAASVLGSVCHIYRGWPNAANLDTDLAAGQLTVTVMSDPGAFRVTTRHIDPPATLAPVTPSLTIAVSGQAATIGGTAAPGQVAGLIVDSAAFVHRTAAGDTPERVAAILASYIRSVRIALVAGATITVPGAGEIIGRVVADQTALVETRRQLQGFRIACWCPDPATRDSLATLLDTALSQVSFITLPDSTAARLRLARSVTFDQSQNANLFRRDLIFDVEYATTAAATLPALIVGATAIAPNGGPVTHSLLG